MTRLLLVRHGESVAQVEGVVGGPKGCRGLSDLGRTQVELLAARWRRTEVQADVLLTSTLPRAIETAEILQRALGVEIEPIEGLCEIAPGECDGMSWDEFEQQFRGVDYRFDPHSPTAPGGESWVQFMDRVSETLAEIVARHDGRTIVAAVHGGVVEGSMVHFLGLSKEAGNLLECTNSSVTDWHHGPRHRGASDGPGWRLLRYNDHAHLE